MSRRSYCVGIFAVFVLCALILTSLSGMFAPMPTKSRTSSSDGWIVGQVTNGTGPIKDAYVLYVLGSGSGGPAGSTWTDSSGHYNLTVLGGVAYTVVAFNGSYFSTGAGAAPAAGKSAWANLTMIPIPPGAADVVLKGFVLDGNGLPDPGGNVAGIVNDPNTGGQGFPMYGNMTTPDSVTGSYTVNVIPGTAGGGIAALDFPGYKFITNTTQDPFVSGHTYWFNITLSNPPSTDDAVLSGNVTDGVTGAPLENAVVSVESQNQGGYSNSTFTNAAGHYKMNVTNGSYRVTFQKLQYSTYQTNNNLVINHGAHISLNATLLATNATVSGNVTDLKTGLRMAGVSVYIVDNVGHFTSTTTNSSGGYTLDAFVTSPEWIGAERTGYSTNNSVLTILPGNHLRINIGLWPLNAWLTGRVTDFITGTPIANQEVQLQPASYGNSGSPPRTNATGVYNFTLQSGNYSIQVNRYNYYSYSAPLQVVPGGNVYNIALMPFNPPLTTRLYGWVNDSVSGVGISNAQVRVGLAAPYNNGKTIQNNTNSAGYYEMWVPPTVMQYVANASGHVHAQELVNATGRTNVMVNVTLSPNPWGPNITYDQSPKDNISWTNPSTINVNVQEKDPQQFVLDQFMFVNASSGTSDYALVQMLYNTFDPLNQGMNNLPFTKSGDNYHISVQWTAEITGGWLRSGSFHQYFGSVEIHGGPTVYQGLRGVYHNSTLGSSQQGTAWFDNATGDFAFFSFDNGTMPFAYPSDTTGTIAPQVSVLRVNNATNGTTWIPGLTEGSWSVVGLRFDYNSTVPSGEYLTVFSVQDFGNRGSGNLTFVTVDDDPPVANAGSDQTVPAGQVVHFDGTSSTDNVGIVNYTWTFDDGGTPITLWGPSQTYTFLTEGVYDVTLTVRDGAGHTSTDVVRITISAAIPEFPTVLVPISGTILIVALVRIRRSRFDE